MSESFEEKYQKKHKTLSLWKSWIRIIAAVGTMILVTQSVNPNTTLDPKFLAVSLGMAILCIGIIWAEFLGIAEEMI
jgi:hypothetical protein